MARLDTKASYNGESTGGEIKLRGTYRIVHCTGKTKYRKTVFHLFFFLNLHVESCTGNLSVSGGLKRLNIT